MFPRRYYPARMFAPVYFPQSEGNEPEEPVVTYHRSHVRRIRQRRYRSILMLLGF